MYKHLIEEKKMKEFMSNVVQFLLHIMFESVTERYLLSFFMEFFMIAGFRTRNSSTRDTDKLQNPISKTV